MSTRGRWEKEKNAVKVVQIAFDVGDEVNRQIRLEALEQGINPPGPNTTDSGLTSQSKTRSSTTFYFPL